VPSRHSQARRIRPSRSRTGLLALAAAAACAATLTPARARAMEHFACSGAHAATRPCQFSTPSGNVHCLWLPNTNAVSCDLVRTGRGYELRPSGKARAVKLKLKSRGETLPTNQQLVFPHSLSCHDTKTTMTCNQDFARGFFKLDPKGSRSA
jgi:hypothetical protein